MPRSAKDLNVEPCSVCGIIIKYKSDIPRHMKIHATNKSELCFKCEFIGCPYKTLQKSNLKIHILTHTREKPFVCRVCSWATSDPGSLTRHRKAEHSHVPARRSYAAITNKESRRYTPYGHGGHYSSVPHAPFPYAPELDTSTLYTFDSSSGTYLPSYPSTSSSTSPGSSTFAPFPSTQSNDMSVEALAAWNLNRDLQQQAAYRYATALTTSGPSLASSYTNTLNFQPQCAASTSTSAAFPAAPAMMINGMSMEDWYSYSFPTYDNPNPTPAQCFPQPLLAPVLYEAPAPAPPSPSLDPAVESAQQLERNMNGAAFWFDPTTQGNQFPYAQ